MNFYLACNINVNERSRRNVDALIADEIMKKRVVITGASRGIGEKLAYHFARFGADIFIIARNEALLRKVGLKCINSVLATDHLIFGGGGGCWD